MNKPVTIQVGHTVMWESDEPDYDYVNDTYDVIRYFGIVKREHSDSSYLWVELTGFVELWGTSDCFVNDHIIKDEMRLHYTELVLWPPNQGLVGKKQKPINDPTKYTCDLFQWAESNES